MARLWDSALHSEPLTMAIFSDRNSLGRLNSQKSLDRIIALWSITSIRALLYSNLLVRSTCRSIGSHTNRLIHCRMGFNIMLRVCVFFPSSWEVCFMFCTLDLWIFQFCPQVLSFYFLPSSFLKFPLLPSSFWNCVPCPYISEILSNTHNFFFSPFLFFFCSYLRLLSTSICHHLC
mgnify:CR=1 FL=1